MSEWIPGVSVTNHWQHVCADGGVVHIARHSASTQVTEDGQREGVAHGVDVEIGCEGRERLPAQEKWADALAQQGEVGVKTRLHQKSMFQKDKADWTWETYVKAAASTIHNLLTRNILISCVNDKIHIRVPAEKKSNIQLNNSSSGTLDFHPHGTIDWV